VPIGLFEILSQATCLLLHYLTGTKGTPLLTNMII